MMSLVLGRVLHEHKEWDRGRWVSALEGCKQHGHAWAVCTKALVGQHWEGRFSCFGLNGLRNEPSCLIGPPFPVFKPTFFTIMASW